MANLAETFCGNSGNYYLSIAGVISMLWWEMGVAATPAPKGLGPRNPTKKLANIGVLLGHLISQNRVPQLSDP